MFYSKKSEKARTPTYRRLFPEVFLYVAFVIQMLYVTFAVPAVDLVGNCAKYLALPLATLGILGIFDIVALFACRLEVYGYMLVACCLAEVGNLSEGNNFFANILPNGKLDLLTQVSIQRFAIAGVLCGMWFGAGVAKIGPWFAYVNHLMTPNNPLLSYFPGLMRALFKDYPNNDRRPSFFCKLTAHVGTGLELVVPLLLIFGPELDKYIASVNIPEIASLISTFFNVFGSTRMLGVYLATILHVYIISQMPFAAVFEWNLSVIAMTWHIWGTENPVKVGASQVLSKSFTDIFSESIKPNFSGLIFLLPLVWFLQVVLVLVPTMGNLFPSKVPFLMAFRPYTGNWRWQFLAFGKDKKKTFAKLAKIKSYESVDPEQCTKDIPGLGKLWTDAVPDVAKQVHRYFVAFIVTFPSYRPILSITETLAKMNGWKDNEIRVLINEWIGTRILGFAFGYGYAMFKPSFHATLQDICGFEKGEVYLIQCEPIPIYSRNVQVNTIDVATGEIVFRNECGWDELSGVGLPCEPCDYEFDVVGNSVELAKREAGVGKKDFLAKKNARKID